jgi:hypothetical protein
MGPSSIDLARHENDLLDRMNRLLAADRLPPLVRLSQLYADVDESFLMTFRELDHHAGRDAVTYWGSWPHRGGVEPEWSDAPGARLLVYLKPMPGPYRLESALSVLRELAVDTLAYVPRAGKSIREMRSRTLRICSEPVNITTALQQCDAALLNGTSGTATQCLLAGVPLVLVPLYLEQVVFSRRVVQLGAGLISEPNRPELLAPRLWRVLHDVQYRLAARAFAQRYANYDSSRCQRELVDRLDSILTLTKVVADSSAFSRFNVASAEDGDFNASHA